MEVRIYSGENVGQMQCWEATRAVFAGAVGPSVSQREGSGPQLVATPSQSRHPRPLQQAPPRHQELLTRRWERRPGSNPTGSHSASPAAATGVRKSHVVTSHILGDHPVPTKTGGLSRNISNRMHALLPLT